MPNFLKKLFPSANEREVKRLMRQVEAVNGLEPRYEAMSDRELAEQTQVFRDQLKSGSTLEDILPKAYALVREGAKRVFGKRLFDMQILGGIVLHQGRIAEMKTGEGKTLTAVLDVYKRQNRCRIDGLRIDGLPGGQFQRSYRSPPRSECSPGNIYLQDARSRCARSQSA